MTRYFYPRSPCGERPNQIEADRRNLAFLSTLSLRRATADIAAILTEINNFYPRSPCGERHVDAVVAQAARNFYPRSPCGERLKQTHGRVIDVYISIHALLAESDKFCGTRSRRHEEFLSTLSLRRATCLFAESRRCTVNFYPRSPCGERPVILCLSAYSWHFYPRSPCGERQAAAY